MEKQPFVIDCLQYCNWSEQIFQEMNRGGVAVMHATIAYHENFPETIANLSMWNRLFEQHPRLIRPGRTMADIEQACEDGRTAVIFGFQNPSPIEDDIGLVEIWHQLGVRFMQLSYNNQSLLASGCYEAVDSGITRMGRQVIAEMNRVGMVVDMSHSAARSTLEAIELSTRPIAISHANPAAWHPARRNKTDDVLRALAASGGMLGVSLYPHHLRGGSGCTLEDFCGMVESMLELLGDRHVGFGTDLCQGQPDRVVEWMRNGTWTRDTDYGEGNANAAGFPAMPAWFQSNADFPKILAGLRARGIDEATIARVAGQNWLEFFRRSFDPVAGA